MSDRPALILVAVGITLTVVAVTFPAWSLAAYPVVAESVDSPPDDDDHFGQVVEIQALSTEERALVERAINGDEAVLVYAPHGSHQTEDGPLPSILSDRWLDSYTVGVYVSHDGQYHEVGASVHGEPLHFIPIAIGGAIGGVVLALTGTVAWHRGWGGDTGRAAAIYALAAIGLLGVIGLLWIGNVHGYLWPIQ